MQFQHVAYSRMSEYSSKCSKCLFKSKLIYFLYTVEPPINRQFSNFYGLTKRWYVKYLSERQKPAIIGQIF